MAWTTVCKKSELAEGQGSYFDIGGREVAVFLHDGKPHVMDDLCPHAGGSMAEGWVEDRHGEACAVCPLHGWAFKLSDGEYADMPGFEIRKFEARVQETDGEELVQADLPMP